MNKKHIIVLTVILVCLVIGVYFSYTGAITLIDKERTRDFPIALINDTDVYINIIASTNDYLFSELEPINTIIIIEPENELQYPMNITIYIMLGFGDVERTLYEVNFNIKLKRSYEWSKALDIHVDESKEYWLWYEISFYHPPSANDPDFRSTSGEKIRIHTESTALQTRMSYEHRALTYGILALGLFTLSAMVVQIYFNINCRKKSNNRKTGSQRRKIIMRRSISEIYYIVAGTLLMIFGIVILFLINPSIGLAILSISIAAFSYNLAIQSSRQMTALTNLNFVEKQAMMQAYINKIKYGTKDVNIEILKRCKLDLEATIEIKDWAYKKNQDKLGLYVDDFIDLINVTLQKNLSDEIKVILREMIDIANNFNIKGDELNTLKERVS